MSNQFSRIIARVSYFPKSFHSFLFTKLFASKVKFAGTSGIKILSISSKRVEIELTNKKKTQNHIGGIHAVAAALLAESATGIVFGMNVSDRCLPLLKSMTIHYQRRMQGNLRATALLTDEQSQQIQSTEKGDLLVPVCITDDSGLEPIECLMNWAWVAKRK